MLGGKAGGPPLQVIGQGALDHGAIVRMDAGLPIVHVVQGDFMILQAQ
jgi:hypothetical protein